eukprot:COSAG06_NODE_7991_length_2309_cov_1.918552_2_plen_188_part_00
MLAASSTRSFRRCAAETHAPANAAARMLSRSPLPTQKAGALRTAVEADVAAAAAASSTPSLRLPPSSSPGLRAHSSVSRDRVRRRGEPVADGTGTGELALMASARPGTRRRCWWRGHSLRARFTRATAGGPRLASACVRHKWRAWRLELVHSICLPLGLSSTVDCTCSMQVAEHTTVLSYINISVSQ